MAVALIVDDQSGYRENLSRCVEKAGLTARTASTIAEAQRIIDQQEVDVLIVDIRMPNGMEGLQFAETIRRIRRRVNIVLITGYGTPEYEQRARAIGAADYLEKPFDLRTLERVLQRISSQRTLLREIHRLEQEVASLRSDVAEEVDLFEPDDADADAIDEDGLPDPLAADCDPDLLPETHQLDDLWFDILGRLMKRRTAREPDADADE